jgi:hypothetical protein
MRFSQVGPDGDLNWDLVAPPVGRISAVFDLAMRPDGGAFAIGGAQTGDAQFQLIVTKLDA